jgi:hypothetical protein
MFCEKRRKLIKAWLFRHGGGFTAPRVCARETLEGAKRHLETTACIREIFFCLRDALSIKFSPICKNA